QQEFTMIYFGDSVTAGGDVPMERRFTIRFTNWLKQQYPAVKFNCNNAAIGGTNSDFGYERFENDVLKYRPDAVTIMFPLNDNALSDENFLRNHRRFVSELRKIGATPVFMTSNAMTRVWMGGFNHTIDRIRKFCTEENIILLDVYRLWETMKNYGIPYETLLANGINHPDQYSTSLFYEALTRLFKA
ncbi:MAG: SGNH/GDSL hydrolase family protein, partial [Patescibacteria group bacterium]